MYICILILPNEPCKHRADNSKQGCKYSQVKGVEEEDEVFALVVRQGDVLEVASKHSCSLEVGSGTCHPQLGEGHDWALETRHTAIKT